MFGLVSGETRRGLDVSDLVQLIAKVREEELAEDSPLLDWYTWR